MTYISWFRETLKESKKQLKKTIVLEDKICWKTAILRAKRILQKRKNKDHDK